MQPSVAHERLLTDFVGDKKCLCNSYIIFMIIVAIFLINIYYCQVYIAQIMKLDVIILCYGGRYLPSN